MLAKYDATLVSVWYNTSMTSGTGILLPTDQQFASLREAVIATRGEHGIIIDCLVRIHDPVGEFVLNRDDLQLLAKVA